jgi:serine/threonine protein kinase
MLYLIDSLKKFDCMINTILNRRYQVREQLSKQPGRRTFLAVDLESENLVAIKILLLDRDFAWEKLKLFEREAKTLKNLNHSAIPQYIDYFEIDLPDYQGFALVQEYIDYLIRFTSTIFSRKYY